MAGLAGGWGRWGQPLADVYKPAPQEQQNQQAGYDVGKWNSLPASEQQKYQAGGGAPGINTAPSKPKMQFAYNTGDRNAPRPNFRYSGMMGNQGILPQVGDPFRRYGTVQGGKVIPPQNPFAEPPGIRYTPGGTWEGGGPGPINTGPSQLPPNMETPGGGGNPWLERGGFTGGQMPPGIGSGTAGASSGLWNPQAPKMDPNTGQWTIPPPPSFEFDPGLVGPSTPPGLRIPRRNPMGGGRYTDPNRASIPDMQQGNPMANRGFRGAYGGAGASLPNRPFRNNLFY